MVVVDSSVWINFFSGRAATATVALRRLLQEGEARIVVPDLVLFEVLRGFRHERDWRSARSLMESLDIESVGGQELIVEASNHYRHLRQAGITVRSSIDVLVAAFCIERGYALLHADRDFEAFETLRGLRTLRH